MKQMKKVLAILLVLGMVFAAVACKDTSDPDNTSDPGNSSTPGNTTDPGNTGNASTKDTLTVVCTADRGTLDPIYAYGYDISNALRMVYETLWDMDRDGNITWILATGIEYVEPTIWHISLREGVTFSNGNPFNADDALFSILRGNNRTGEPPFLPELDMENSKVLDEYTLELVFHAYDLSYVAGITALPIVDAESFDEDVIATTAMGTGPYELTTYVINSHVDFKARDNYWGEKALIENLHVIILAEDAQRVNALQTGTADIASVPFQDISYVESLDGITTVIRASAMASALYFNTSSQHSTAFYDNADARKAVALAIDREAIVDIAYSGYASESRYPLSMGNMDWEDRFLDLGVYGIGYDPDLARQYAESSGLVNNEILLINDGASASVVICELIQSNLRDIGVTVNINSLDAGSWLSIVFDPSQFDMAISATNAPSLTLAQNYYAWAVYMNGGTYLTDPWPGRDRYLELIDGIMAVSDANELSSRYMELTEIHVEGLLWYSLADLQTAFAHNSDLVGYHTMLLGNTNYAKLSWAS